MQIKLNPVKRPTGISVARAAVSYGVLDSGAEQVTLNLSAEDCYGIATTVASLRLSPAEARELAARLIAESAPNARNTRTEGTI